MHACPASPVSRRTACASILLGLGLPAAFPAGAQGSYPSRPIVLVVPQAAGGTNDIVGRIVAQKLGEKLAAATVVENRPGAGGNIGTQAVAKASRDGYTLLMTISSSQAINPALYKAPGFDPVADFTPVSMIGAVPNVLLAHPSFPAKTVPELLALAKSKPGQLQYASAGNGTLNHLLGEMLNQMAGIELQHVPYKGVAPALNDVLGGQLPLLFGSLPSTLAHIKAGRLRALAVSSTQRSPVLPDVPSIAESVPGYNGTLWIGLFSPSSVPRDVIDRLGDGMRQAMADKEMRDKLEAQGVELAGTPAKPVMGSEFAAILQQDIAKWARIVKTSGATIN